jgi:hypothetical protein
MPEENKQKTLTLLNIEVSSKTIDYLNTSSSSSIIKLPPLNSRPNSSKTVITDFSSSRPGSAESNITETLSEIIIRTEPSLNKLLEENRISHSEKNLEEIAKLLMEGERAEKFKQNHPKFYNKQIKRMQQIGLLGKEKDNIFTPGENQRLEMNEQEKGLNISSIKSSGSAIGEIREQDKAKEGHSKKTKYMLKQAELNNNNERNNVNILREISGARFYANFSHGVEVAKTRIVKRTNGQIEIGSRWIDGFSTYYSSGDIPELIDGKVITASNNFEIKGYIPMLVTAKFIQDFDCIGWGSNARYLNTPKTRVNGSKVYTNAKIDPGRAFGFLDNEDKEGTSDISLGVLYHVQQKMAGKDFHTHLPLDFIDPDNPLKLRSDLGSIKLAIEYYYPNFDTRDLLMGEMTYAEISNHPKTYNQMAKSVDLIASSSEDDLKDLIDLVPNYLNQEDLTKYKEEMLAQLITRRNIMRKLYAQEIEYMKLYNQALIEGNKINFEAMKAQAALQAKATPASSMPMSKTLRSDILKINNILLSELIASHNTDLVAKIITTNHHSANQPLTSSLPINHKIELFSEHETKEKGIYRRVEEKTTPLKYAIKHGNSLMIETILSFNPNINEISYEEVIIHDGQLPLKSFIFAKSPIIEGIDTNDIKIIKKILEHNPQIDQVIENEFIDYKNGNEIYKKIFRSTPLIEAISEGNIEIITEILKHNPNPDKLISSQIKAENTTTFSHTTALTEAIKINDTKIIEAIFEKSPQANFKNTINKAIEEKNTNAIEIIIAYRYDLLIDVIKADNSKKIVEYLFTNYPDLDVHEAVTQAINEHNVDAVEKILHYQPSALNETQMSLFKEMKSSSAAEPNKPSRTRTKVTNAIRNSSHLISDPNFNFNSNSSIPTSNNKHSPQDNISPR